MSWSTVISRYNMFLDPFLSYHTCWLDQLRLSSNFFFKITVHVWNISCQWSGTMSANWPPHVNSFNAVAYARNSQQLAQKSCSGVSWSAGLRSILECLLVIEKGKDWSPFWSKTVLSVRLVPKRKLRNTCLCHSLMTPDEWFIATIVDSWYWVSQSLVFDDVYLGYMNVSRKE